VIIVITEKAVAGQRIAEILAKKNVPTKFADKAPYMQFQWNENECFVIPLRGHIVEVDFPQRYSYWLGTDLKQLTNAEIEYIGKEKQIISFLKKMAPEADEVIIATDADREGESIGVEALNFVKEANPKIKIKRAYFSAITPKDINESFQSLRPVDYNFADSADSRREIDLIWGAVLTRFLSLVSGRMGKDFLSVGRVQSPTLAIIVDREKERLAFVPTPYFELKALCEKDKKDFEAEHKKGRFLKKEEAEKAFENVKNAKQGKVLKVDKKKKTIEKPIPFNTTLFLREATTIGFSASMAMSTAESLYLGGFISYPRTDNTVYPATLNLKETLLELKKVPDFYKLCEKILAQKEIIPSSGKEATKDHPPIYPVAFAEKSRLSPQQWKIYELVARRFMATVSEEAETENIIAEIEINLEPFIARGQTILKMGWKEFYPYSKISEIILPELQSGDIVNIKKMDFLSKETQPPARYSQSTLLKLMEENKLGTKSTRAEIIAKLYARKYIAGNQSIIPNKIAFAVIDSLEKSGGTVTKPKMTSELEEEMDMIAAGNKKKTEVVEDSRKLLMIALEELSLHKTLIAQEIRKALLFDSIVGNCTREGCTGQLLIRHGKTGKRFLGCSSYPNCTQSYPLPQKGKIYTLDKKCPECGKPMVKVQGTRAHFEICVDMDCKSKDAWKKRQEEKAVAKANEEKAKETEHEESKKAKEESKEKNPKEKTPKEILSEKKPAKEKTAKELQKKDSLKKPL